MALALTGNLTPRPQRAMSTSWMPVVVEAIAGELMLRRRTEPHVVVDSGGYRLDRRTFDGVAPFEAQAASHVDVAQFAFTHLLHGFLERR